MNDDNISVMTWHFNPRSREGSDVSSSWNFFETGNYFNPRSREGSDFQSLTLRLCFMLFQSTLPRGERHGSGHKYVGVSSISIHAPARGATLSLPEVFRPHRHFNPRSREGSDVTGAERSSPGTEFQSTLPRGERHSWPERIRKDWNFNPRSREGSDPRQRNTQTPRAYFNPRSREGSDVFRINRYRKCNDFNPRSREGSDAS